MKPLIAVTGPDKSLKIAWWATRWLLSRCGMRSVYLNPGHPTTEHRIQGVIIGGGDDIEPKHYGQMGNAGVAYDPLRDAFEMTVIKHCVQSDIPLLGICRGSQLLNVVLGGSLHPDIRPLRKHTPNINTVFPVKWITVDKNSKLSTALSSTRFKVNSLHKQAVDRLGDGLRTIAVDADGFIQGIESSDGRLTGVQWHPEYMPYSKTQKELFLSFVAQAQSATGTQLPMVQISGQNPDQ